MRVAVDDDRCRGHAVCCAICPEVFDIGAGGYAVVRHAEVPERFEEAVLDAAASCPEHAITAS
jgi:ferredoxin